MGGDIPRIHLIYLVYTTGDRDNDLTTVYRLSLCSTPSSIHDSSSKRVVGSCLSYCTTPRKGGKIGEGRDRGRVLLAWWRCVLRTGPGITQLFPSAPPSPLSSPPGFPCLF